MNTSKHVKLFLLLFSLFNVFTTITAPAPWNDRQVTKDHNPKLNDYCDYDVVNYFYAKMKENLANQQHVIETILGTEYPDPKNGGPTKRYLDPKVMCIRTDPSGNIDMTRYDCHPNGTTSSTSVGYCNCGQRLSRIDENDIASRAPHGQLNLSTYTYDYIGFHNLQRRLVMYKFDGEGEVLQCVAVISGHCTLNQDKTSLKILTHCKPGTKCLNASHITSQTPILNPATGKWWGVCVPEETREDIHDPFSNHAFPGASPQFCLWAMYFILGLIQLLNIHRKLIYLI